jgi:hypothetical protein
MAKRPTKSKAEATATAAPAAASTDAATGDAGTVSAEAAPAKGDGPFVSVRSRRPQGRRRAGITFGSSPVEVDLSQLSPLQVDALATDPDLVVDPPIA